MEGEGSGSFSWSGDGSSSLTSSSGSYEGGGGRDLSHQILHLVLPKLVVQILLPILLVLAGVFSGLTVAFLKFDKTGLEVVMNSGSEQNKKYARGIYDLRQRGNLIFCAMVLINTLIAASFTVLLASITSQLVAFVVATLLLMLFGEVIPRALSTRYALVLGYYGAPVVRVVMLLLFPFAWPISKLLDFLIGHEAENRYTRAEMTAMMAVSLPGMTQMENNLMTSILDFSGKQISKIMTPLEEVYMLEADEILDNDLVEDAIRQGYSRILVYEKDRQNIKGLLLLKDLVLHASSSRNMPIRDLLAIKGKNTTREFPDEYLHTLLGKLTAGVQLVLVHDVVSEGPGDPYYKILGIVTLEDVVGELLSDEMVDESDVYLNYNSKARVDVIKGRKGRVVRLTEQEAKGCVHFLSRLFPGIFGEGVIEPSVLQKMITQTVAEEVETGTVLCQAGKPNRNALLFLRGKIRVENAAGELVEERTMSHCWGIQVLTHGSMTPDFTLIAAQPSIILKISKRSYQVATNVSVLERKLRREQEEREDQEEDEEE